MALKNTKTVDGVTYELTEHRDAALAGPAFFWESLDGAQSLPLTDEEEAALGNG